MREGRNPEDRSILRSAPGIEGSWNAQRSSAIQPRPATWRRNEARGAGAEAGAEAEAEANASPAPLRTLWLPWQPPRAWPKLTISPVPAAPTPSPALTCSRARPLGTRGRRTHTPSPAVPRACSPALTKGTQFTPGRLRRLREPKVAAGSALIIRGREQEAPQSPQQAQAHRCPEIPGF